MEAALPGEIARRLAEAESGAADPGERGAVWTYLTTDQPFGSFSQRLGRGIARRFKSEAKSNSPLDVLPQNTGKTYPNGKAYSRFGAMFLTRDSSQAYAK